MYLQFQVIFQGLLSFLASIIEIVLNSNNYWATSKYFTINLMQLIRQKSGIIITHISLITFIKEKLKNKNLRRSKIRYEKGAFLSTRRPKGMRRGGSIYNVKNVDVFRFFSSPKIGNHTENREIAPNFQNQGIFKPKIIFRIFPPENGKATPDSGVNDPESGSQETGKRNFHPEKWRC